MIKSAITRSPWKHVISLSVAFVSINDVKYLRKSKHAKNALWSFRFFNKLSMVSETMMMTVSELHEILQKIAFYVTEV